MSSLLYIERENGEGLCIYEMKVLRPLREETTCYDAKPNRRQSEYEGKRRGKQDTDRREKGRTEIRQDVPKKREGDYSGTSNERKIKHGKRKRKKR